MSHRVEPTTAAARQVRTLPRPARDRVLDVLEALADGLRPANSRKLVGEQTARRGRVGDYRVLYAVFDAESLVTVVRAGHRREVHGR